MRKYLLYTILSIFILSLFVGCNADGVGIFYTLAKEEELSGSDLQGLYIRSFVNIGSDVFCGAGPSIWKDNGSSWKNVSKSGYNSDPAIASDGTTIYAALYDEDDTDEMEKTLWSYDGSSWTEVTTTFGPSTSMWLLDTSDLDFIVCSPDENDSYDIYSTDYSTLNDLSLNTAYPITDAAYDGSGTYVLVGGSYDDNPIIYYGDGTSFTAATSTVSNPIGGVIYDTNTSLFYLTTKGGNLWSSSDGDTWAVVDDAPDNYSDNTPELLDMGVVTFDGTHYLVIGANEGYYEMNLSGTSISRPEGTIDSDTDIEASYSTFADGLVRCFYTVEDNHFLMGTATGVWENDNGDLDQK
ncbi:hypothetical protein [Sediminispirochaeta bajacaliforniensis]|uniref:hypothetical protein n=1 Tax=Sediminispirochaeta bajacaliforniensis TaxID=148 RepID=UPI00036CDD46|nr:hypothetical protein [Sediminispirochaeta bajacaliforniensis]